MLVLITLGILALWNIVEIIRTLISARLDCLLERFWPDAQAPGLLYFYKYKTAKNRVPLAGSVC